MIQFIYPQKDIFIFSSIYNHLDKVIKIIDEDVDNDCIFILNGNICGQKNNQKIFEDIEKLKKIVDNNRVYYLLGDLDLIFIKDCYRQIIINDNLNWLNNQHIYCKIKLLNQRIINIVSGGLDIQDPKLNKIESCFINNEDWHKTYNGNLGLIISNYPNNLDNCKKIYEYSCSIGVSPDHLSCQKINNLGLSDFIVI